MTDKPTFDTVITESLSTLDLGATITPLPDKFGQDYKALHNWHIEHLAGRVADLPAITDAKTYDQNQKARTHLVSLRTKLDKTRKALFEPMRALKAQVDDYIGTTPESGLQARLKALERIIEAKQAVWDAERERERQEAIRKIEERTAARNKRMMDAGAAFDGVTYRIGEVEIPLREVSSISDELFDRLWDQSIAPAAARLAEERLVEERFAALLAAGMRPDPITGDASYTLSDGREIIIMREALHTMAQSAIELELGLIADDIAALKRAKDEEHEAMRRRFEEQAARERKADEDRAELDRQREALRQEKRELRRARILDLGAIVTPLPDGLDAIQYDPEDTEKAIYDLPNLSEVAWAEALGYIKEQVEQRAQVLAAKRAVAMLVKQREAQLLVHGAQVDDAGTWTLGNASTTRHLLGQMDAEAWNACISAFEAEEEAIEAQSAQHLTAEETRTGHVDTRELLACALALLDEANKCETIAADDLDDDECEQMCVKVVAHASDCVNLVRELQAKRA